MRGSPIIQALILLCIFLPLGYLGKIYIQIDQKPTVSTTSEIPKNLAHDFVEAEIELTFSSPPVSYELKRLLPNSSSEISILKQSSEIENPSYEDVALPSHHMTTYLLDIVWYQEPSEGSRHFIQINISPTYGEPKSLSFTTHSKDLLETFEYSSSSPNELSSP